MEVKTDAVFAPLSPDVNTLGPLAELIGTWEGTGFNVIWLPSFGKGQDHSLEINLTNDTITFEEIQGEIPNRGLMQADIMMRGLTYFQKVTDANMKVALHIEPGIWAVVPATVNPPVEQTVVRMASIPHGTAIVAQGTATVSAGVPKIPDSEITPFEINNTARKFPFPESNLSIQSNFRSSAEQLAGVQQHMIDNPNSVLQNAINGQDIISTTTLLVTTTCAPTPGGGTANTAFLQGGEKQSNAQASEVVSTFWVETIRGEPNSLQLQFSQTVLLDFAGLSWPHVSVATLRKKIEAESTDRP